MHLRHVEWLIGDPVPAPEVIIYEVRPYAPVQAERVIERSCLLAGLDVRQAGDDPERAERVRQAFARIVDAARVRQGTGIAVHPHLFRHIAGKLLLDEHPGDQGTVQRMLGHKSIRTTMATYTGAETRAAVRRYDEVVLGLRAQALSRAGVAA